MNRQDWERQVHESNMNVTAKCIALVLGSFGNWTVDKTVEPGATKVAKYSGLTASTVKEYVNEMVEQGWLRPVGTGKYNTTIYELCEVVTNTTGILARTPRKMNPRSTAKLRNGQDSLVPDTRELVPDTSESKFPIPDTLVPGSTDSNLTNLDKQPSKNLNKSPGSDEPVDRDDSLNLQVKEEAEVITTPKRNFLETLEQRSFDRITSNLNRETKQEALNLILTTKVPGKTFEEKVFNVLADLGEATW